MQTDAEKPKIKGDHELKWYEEKDSDLQEISKVWDKASSRITSCLGYGIILSLISLTYVVFAFPSYQPKYVPYNSTSTLTVTVYVPPRVPLLHSLIPYVLYPLAVISGVLLLAGVVLLFYIAIKRPARSSKEDQAFHEVCSVLKHVESYKKYATSSRREMQKNADASKKASIRHLERIMRYFIVRKSVYVLLKDELVERFKVARDRISNRLIYAIQTANPDNLSKPTTTIKVIGEYLLDPTFANLDTVNESLKSLDPNPDVTKQRSVSAIVDVFQDRIIQNQMVRWIGVCIVVGIAIYFLGWFDHTSADTSFTVSVGATIGLIVAVIGYFAYQARQQSKP